MAASLPRRISGLCVGGMPVDKGPICWHCLGFLGVTLTVDRTVRIGIAGSLAVHLVLFLILAWMFGARAASQWWEQRMRDRQEAKEVALVYPEQIMVEPAPPLPKPKPKPMTYIRTTQNEASAAVPDKADFISDRNTVAASKKAPFPDGDKPMPTMDGIDHPTMELANRNFREGETKEDSAPAAPKPPAMLQPSVQPLPPPPARPPAPSKAIAKVTPEVTPLSRMMEEMDKDMARVDITQLPLQVKRAEAASEVEKRTAAQQQPPPPPKAIPVGQRPPPSPAVLNPVEKAFQPFTRTSKVKGTISNRGENAVNAAETPMGKYMRTVTSAVEKKWHFYRRQRADAVSYGNLKLRFFVTKSGKPVDLQIVSDPKEADPRMTDFTLQSILEAEIPPIPPDLVPMLDDERLEIEYDVLIY